VRRLQFSRRVPGWPAFRIILWWEIVRGIVLLYLKFAYRIQCSGHEHIPRKGPIIYVSNHQSHLDPPIVGVLITDRPFSGMARSTLFTSKAFAWIIRGIGAIPIEKGRGDSGAMKAGLDELAKGRCLLIFPEGTRTRDGAMAEFQRGAMLLIKRSAAPVVPVAIEGAFDVWPIGRKFPKFTGRIRVQAGPAISAEELMRDGADAGLERLKRIIEGMRLDLRHQMRRASGGKYPLPGLGDAPYWERPAEN